jgi:hypothetical protein
MKDKKSIIIASFLAVMICLILATLLFVAVTPTFLITLAFAVGIITGVCITLLIHNIINIIKSRRLKKLSH